MHDAYISRRFRWMKITYKTSDAAENLQLYRVVPVFHPRLSCTTTHISADILRITLNASCMTILGGRTKQLDIFCRVTGFTIDFLSFIAVELIRFFHGAIQLGFCMPEITNIGSGFFTLQTIKWRTFFCDTKELKNYKVSTQTCLVPWQGRGLV